MTFHKVRFLEWVCENPKGLVALPTGRTPEFFIKYLERYKNNWDDAAVQAEIKSCGYSHRTYPDTSALTFVMLDEFFPMLPTHRNSFCNYIKNFYVSILEIPESNVMNFDLVGHQVLTSEELHIFNSIDVDLSLLTRAAVGEAELRQKDILLRVTSFCEAYESRLEEMGGIGFFLGGIGPDGHIAFNQQGGDHNSVTRLVNFNYPSAAAAAADLGGIEIARGKAAMTIGLRTITANPDATIIIMAAGEGKASVVRAAIEDSVDEERPASVLQSHRGARFYLTHGAAMLLTVHSSYVYILRCSRITHTLITPESL